MIKLSLIFTRLFLCISLALLTPTLGAEPQEPPLKCEVARGAWCIVSGIGEIRFVARESEKWNKWSLYDNYWKREVGVVLEGIACNDTVADRVELIKVRQNVLWERRRWKEATVSLRRDGTCALRLMVPASDPTFVRKAASSLSGHVAACIAGHACAENLLSTLVYKALE